jgi:16S rRNA (cytidine1402-2'-O)-methyltransferase
VARELTKVHEEIVRGTLSEVAGYYRERPARGEVTVVLGPSSEPAASQASPEEAGRLAQRLIEGGMRPSAAARELSLRLDLARNEAYRIVHDLQGRATDE